MIYLSQMLGKPVVDAAGSRIGTISDIAIATGEVFPRVTSLAFLGPDKTPFMLSWRKYVGEIDDDQVTLTVPAPEIRFSYLQPDEVLLHRDLLNKQIVDTQGMKVVRVNDLKLSESRNQLRLLGAEVGMRGILRGVSPVLETFVARATRLFGTELNENLIAWNYMDLLDRDLSQVKLSVTHKRLHELHPADVADILEQLSPSQRAAVFAHLDNEAAADTISELEDDLQADVIDDLSETRASSLLAEMDPDDAADIIGDLPYDKAERLLRLMGLDDASAIRGLLGYKEKTAGGIMTPEVTIVTEDMTVQEVIEHLREVAEERESIYYVYVVEGERKLAGVISLRDLLLAQPETTVAQIAETELFTADPDDDQEDVAEQMAKYDLLALPVVDERGTLLGIVTVDDALDVLEEEAEEDLALATGSSHERGNAASLGWWVVRRSSWAIIWLVVLFADQIVRTRMRDVDPFAVQPWILYGLAFATVASVLMPLLLRTGEESSSRAVAELITGSAEDERPSLGRRLLTEGGVGVVVSVIAGLIAFALLELQTGSERSAAVFGGVTALSVVLTVLFGGLLAELALRRRDADKPVSSTMLATTSMVFAAAVYTALSFAGGWLVTLG
ncbi:MAG: magnesium transporter [Coriobacteriia bacterium]|nr:magnesium transporter [Coriobacteriia bacterium]